LGKKPEFSTKDLKPIKDFNPGGELLRLLVNSTGEGIYSVDMKGNCTFANPACVKLLGFKSDTELIGRHMHNLVHHTRPNGEPYPVEECRIYQAFINREGTHVDDEVMFCFNGKPFPAEYWSYPIVRDEKLMGCVVTFVDISERKRTEKLINEQSEKLAEIARFPEMNPGPVLRIDLEGTVLMANQAAYEVFGKNLVSSCWRDICPGIDEAWNEIVGIHDGITIESKIDERVYLFTHRHDIDAKLIFVFGTDITPQKTAEKELREKDEMVRLLMNSTGEGIYAVDLKGNCTFANNACVKILGFKSEDELLGEHMHDLVHHTRPNGEPYPVEQCRIYQAFRKHEGTHVDDEVMFCSNGKPFPAEYWSYPIVRDEKLMGCVVTFVDISERRKVEEELRQTEKMAALGKLSAGLAHELNNPASAAGRAANQLIDIFNELQALTVKLSDEGITPDIWDEITNWQTKFQVESEQSINLSPLELSDRENELTDWLDSHGINDGWEIASTLVKAGTEVEDLESIAGKINNTQLGIVLEWLSKSHDALDLSKTVAHSSQRISELVGVVKSYSHMDKANKQYIDIHNGIEDTLKIFVHKLKHGIEVVRKYERELPLILTNASELNQVWTNLIDNAIDALKENGIITIRTYQEGDYIVVSITDNGPGIPEEIQSRIFDPFFTTKEVGDGTGLGLDVVRRIITGRCNGNIELSSYPGETTFVVKLPINISDEVNKQSATV